VSERSIRYVISFDTTRHLVQVRATFKGPLPEPLSLQMPCWTPGSYLVREYARHVEGLRAFVDDRACGARKSAKDTWAIAHGGASEVVVEYSVYAHELTVRTNHVSDTHGYFNGAATFLRPVGDASFDWESLPIELELQKPDAKWSIATGLARAESKGENVFVARDFDQLVDCPVDVGVHERHEFTVENKPHAIVLWGSPNRCDRDRLVRDVTRIVQSESAMFGGLPYDSYLFLLHLAPGGRGGLEHENSTALLASPDAFDTDSNYEDLLSLFAHEFFHLWQVKRTRPAGLRPYRYQQENYTRMLWLFEGGTSYYDWLTLRRSALVSPKKYLDHFAGEIARLEDTPGRFAQTVEEASFDAWIKLYRPDEHSVNSTVSYYLKGEIICALLDCELRARSKGAKSLDDVIKYVWREFGQNAKGIPEDEIERVFATATGLDVSDLIDAWVRSTQPLAYDETLAKMGLTLRAKGARGAALGVRTRSEGGRCVLASVLRDSAAERAGLSPGDEIVAIDGRRVDEGSLRRRLEARKPGESVELVFARREWLQTTKVVLAEPSPDGYEIIPASNASEAARQLGAAWLGPDAESFWSAKS
jgi:predicted metalloprotease with PDZ domain